jgi:FLVCR family MFS transporter 7
LTSVDAGVLGSLILLGGIIGTVILSPLSDRFKTRKPFIVFSNILLSISMIAFAFADNVVIFNIFGLLLGVGLMGAGSVVLEYSSEITSPVPEVSSNGIIMVVGQLSGIIFILGLERFTTPSGDYFPSLIFLSVLTFLSLILTFFIKEKST